MNKRTLTAHFLLVLGALMLPAAVRATGVPIAGFLPQVGLTLTDEFESDNDPEFDFYIAKNESSLTGSQFGLGGTPYYDVALLDTGAGASLITTAADAKYNVAGAGFRGSEFLTIGGATGFLDANINNAMAMFATGLGNRAGSAPLTFSTANSSIFKGQSSISLLTMPPETDLPNVVGIPFLSQYATYVRSDQPQIFQLDGQTVRSPQITFSALGSGGQGIARRAPMSVNPGAAFTSPPAYVFNFENLLSGDPLTEDPMAPTVLQQSGGMFLNVNAKNDGAQLGNTQFLFDTGADVTVVSTLNALFLGFDVGEDEPDFTVAVVGSGGINLEVPGFYADEFTIFATGGNVVLTNVPIVVLDVVNPADPGNNVPGIVGTNLLAGRNVVIDPVPTVGGGGNGPSLYISDPVTAQKNWTTAAASGTFATDGNWSGNSAPTNLSVANVRHVAGGFQTAVVAEDATVWELNVSGSATQTMSLAVNSGVTLTTFSGINIETNGIISLDNATLDAQFVEVVGGTLQGAGQINTGSGLVPGQVENRGGIVAPGNGVGTLDIEGRFASDSSAALEIELGGLTAATQYDQLQVEGGVALAGTLAVSFVNLGSGIFAPSVGNSFTIITATDGISGEFDELVAPGGYNWRISYGASSVELSVGIPGDYNDNGIVDAADYSVWRNSMNESGSNLAADGDGNGSIGAGDFLVWKSHFGESLGLGSARFRRRAGSEQSDRGSHCRDRWLTAPAPYASSLRCGASSCR